MSRTTTEAPLISRPRLLKIGVGRSFDDPDRNEAGEVNF
jgi:hypothetical protein